MNAVVTTSEQLPALNNGATLLQVISRAASDPNCDIEKMKSLLAMHREMQQQEAEVAFNASMASMQAKMRRISTDKSNSQTHSEYATYGKLDRILRPLYTEEGFALSFGTEETPLPEMVRVVCHVTHRDGFTRKHAIDMPSDGKGAKGNDVMTKTHATGSATRYGMRYLLMMIFNVAIGDDPDDDDGNGGEEEIDQGWFDGIDAAVDQFGLKALKAEMVTVFGKTTDIPKRLIRAYNERWAVVSPAREDGAKPTP